MYQDLGILILQTRRFVGPFQCLNGRERGCRGTRKEGKKGGGCVGGMRRRTGKTGPNESLSAYRPGSGWSVDSSKRGTCKIRAQTA